MNKELHEQAIYPEARVRTSKAGGSGTLIYSKPNASGKQETFIITNHHVIADAVHIHEEWDSYLNRKVKREYRDKISVEIFRYIYGSRMTAASAFGGIVEAYQERPDLALVKLDDDVYAPDYIATLFPKVDNPYEHVHYGDATVALGCALGEPVVVTSGNITNLNKEIDNYEYWMSTAQIIFGNSGGAVFLDKPLFHVQGDGQILTTHSYKFLGIPSRLPVTGFMGSDAITHMGYFIPFHRIYKFLQEENFDFIYDDKVTSEECAKKREDRKKLAEIAIERMRRGVVEEPEQEEKRTDKHEEPHPDDDDEEPFGWDC